MINNKYSFLAIIILLAIANSASFAAEGLLAKYSAPLPDVTPISDISDKTTLKTGIPLNNKSIEFSVRIPNGWSEELNEKITDPGLEKKALFEVSKYEGSPKSDGTSSLSVDVLTIPYQTTAAVWLLHNILRNSYTLQGLVETDDRRAEAVYIIFDDGKAYAVRALALISANHLVLVRYKVPVMRWDDEKSLQAAVINSFTLTNQEGGAMEEMRMHFFLDISSIEYPVSWRLSAQPVRSIDRMTANLLNITADGILDGEMYVVMLSRYSGIPVSQEVETLKESLKEKGLTLSDKIEDRKDVIYPKEVEFKTTEVYSVKSTDKPMVPYEFWFTIMTSGDYTYIVTLFTPSRDVDYFVWARNAQTYKLVISSFKPQ